MKTFICPACRGALIDVLAGYCNSCRRTTVQTGCSQRGGLYLVTDPPPEQTLREWKTDVFLSYSIGFGR